MNYRDDLIEILTASDNTNSVLKAILNDRITTRDGFHNHQKENTADIITITDKLTDGVLMVVQETLAIKDGIGAKQTSKDTLTEKLWVADDGYRIYKEMLADGITAIDTLRQTAIIKQTLAESIALADMPYHIIKNTLIDGVGITDNDSNQRSADTLIKDHMVIKDWLMVGAKHIADEVLQVADNKKDRQIAKNKTIDNLTIADTLTERFFKLSTVKDRLMVGDNLWDRLIAKDVLQDRAMIAVVDEVVQDDGAIAWTMNTINQAMSQYNPYNVDRVVVIDGVLYGECKDGVYRLDGTDELITATIITDKIDYGQNLVKPSYAYTEYQTNGAVKLTVHTTQKGTKQHYTYTLPKEKADEMTNGRFVFGRGLYGRQFGYTLAITAKQALLHDLVIHFEQTARRL